MEYRMPDYYNDFKCIAGACPCTCCSGWGIYIDDRTYEKYNDSEATTKAYIMKHIDQDEQCFKNCNGRCSFLNDDKLCELIIHEGEDMLCDTCRRYPRHYELYGDMIEAALSISCPVVAKMIIDRPELDKFKVRETDKQSAVSKEVDKKLLQTLMMIRKEIFAIAMERDIDLDQRMREILVLSDKCQSALYKYDKTRFKVSMLGDRLKKQIGDFLQTQKQMVFEKNRNVKAEANYRKRYQLMKQYADMLLGLEMINDEWPSLVNNVIDTLYINMTEDAYIANAKAFHEYVADVEYEYEHIFVYFLYTYFLGGVYDSNIMGMVKLSVLSTLFIREMSFAEWMNKNKQIDVEARIRNCYLYSRQVEHSDDNLLSLEGILTAHPLCSVENMISIL